MVPVVAPCLEFWGFGFLFEETCRAIRVTVGTAGSFVSQRIEVIEVCVGRVSRQAGGVVIVVKGGGAGDG